jgi:hypothetical protein
LLFLVRWDGEPYWLVLDRTNWQFGKQEHNLLVLSAQLGDTAVPLFFHSLGKAGNSDAAERIALLERALKLLPRGALLGVLGDREFVGEAWLSWLKRSGLPFIMRLKDNFIVSAEGKDTCKLRRYYARLAPGAVSQAKPMTFTSGLTLMVQAKRIKDDLVIVAFQGEFAAKPINCYRKRWRIECGFACLKRKGFELEDTHLQCKERIYNLFAAVAIAFAWAVAIGKLVKRPTVKNNGYPANATFTLGKQRLVHAACFTEKIYSLIAYAFNIIIFYPTVV